MTQEQQPDALRLADAMDQIEAGVSANTVMADASAELRRLHARVQELEAKLSPLKPKYPSGLTSINARISFDNGWRHCEREHGIGDPT